MQSSTVDETPAAEGPTTLSAPGLLARVARQPVVVVGAVIAAGLAAAAYIDLYAVINPNTVYVDQKPEYVLLACSSAVACAVALLALAGTRMWGRGAARFRLESWALALVALTYGLDAAASATMVGDFHSYGLSASGIDQTLQWTGDIAGIALFALLVIDAVLAADDAPATEVWWRGCLTLAAAGMLAVTVVKFTAALTNVVYSHGDETWIGVFGVLAGVLVAASATRPGWWWRVGVGFGLAVTGVSYVELGRVGPTEAITRVGDLSLGIALGDVVLALTGVAWLVLFVSGSRTPPGPARYPD